MIVFVISSMSNVPVLYSYFRSSCSYRVRIVLNLKKIPHRIVPINLLKEEQKHSVLLNLNPQRTVPALFIKGQLLTQSLAIIDYLDGVHHEPSMCPRDELVRSRVLAAALICTADTQPLHNSAVLQNLPEDQRTPWALWANRRGLTALELHAREFGSDKFCVGDAISMADVCLAPQVYAAERFGVDVNKEFPTIARIHSHLMVMPEFRKAHPHAQSDCPVELQTNFREIPKPAEFRT